MMTQIGKPWTVATEAWELQASKRVMSRPHVANIGTLSFFLFCPSIYSTPLFPFPYQIPEGCTISHITPLSLQLCLALEAVLYSKWPHLTLCSKKAVFYLYYYKYQLSICSSFSLDLSSSPSCESKSPLKPSSSSVSIGCQSLIEPLSEPLTGTPTL